MVVNKMIKISKNKDGTVRLNQEQEQNTPYDKFFDAVTAAIKTNLALTDNKVSRFMEARSLTARQFFQMNTSIEITAQKLIQLPVDPKNFTY